MIIGIPKEIKKQEYRVGITPIGVKELKGEGHTVLVETRAGEGSGFSDNEYLNADADIVDKQVVFEKSDLIVKVKEPLPPEYEMLKDGQAIFTFLHLAANRELTEALLKKKITALAYETLRKDETLPLLVPMSEIAGRMAPLVGASCLQKFQGGSGVLPTGATGVRPAKAVILGAGTVGMNAARVCNGLGTETVVINRGQERLRQIDEMFLGQVKTLSFAKSAVEEEVRQADLIIGAVLVPGGRTPVLITKDMLKTMKRGAVM